MRSIVLIVGIFLTLNSNGQDGFGIYGSAGLNRIGVLYALGSNYQKKSHTFSLGTRLYEPDLVFEKNYPGIDLAYTYAFRSDRKMKLLLGISLSGFYENKIVTNLWVFDPKIITGPKWELSDHFQLNLAAGFGTVINKVETSNSSSIETFKYINYELALGLTFQFSDLSDD